MWHLHQLLCQVLFILYTTKLAYGASAGRRTAAKKGMQ